MLPREPLPVSGSDFRDPCAVPNAVSRFSVLRKAGAGRFPFVAEHGPALTARLRSPRRHNADGPEARPAHWDGSSCSRHGSIPAFLNPKHSPAQLRSLGAPEAQPLHRADKRFVPVCFRADGSPSSNSFQTYGRFVMKHKVLAFVLALMLASWAQTVTQTTPSAPQQGPAPTEKTKCGCCDKMAASSSKDAPACCAHNKGADAKETASCCSGKDAKSCCGGKDAKSCMEGDKTAKSCGKDCCGKNKTAASCCDKSAKKCEKDCRSRMKSEKPA